jgi:hypothetical protein
MLDLKKLAYDLLEQAKKDLQETGVVLPTATVIAKKNYCIGMRWRSHREKLALFGEVYRLAKRKQALAVIMVMDCYCQEMDIKQKDSYRYGDVTNNPKRQEAIHVMIKPSQGMSWAISCIYTHNGSEYQFETVKETDQAMTSLLEDW